MCSSCVRITVLKFRPCTSQAPRTVLLMLYLASSSKGFITLHHRQTNTLHPSQSSTGNTSSESRAEFRPRPRRLHATNLQRPSMPVPHLLSWLDLSPFPASEQTLMLFVPKLASRIQPQSIPVYLSAILALHIAHGCPNPLDDALQLCQTVRGINRLHGITAKQKLAITIKLLCDMKQFISLSSHDDYVKWSAMVTAHFFLLRCGEFTVLHPKDFCPDQHLTLADVQSRTSPDGTEFIALRLKTSKTDQFRRSHTLVSRHSKSDICPVCYLQMLICHYNPSSHDYNTTPLFALQDGSPLTRPCLLSFSSQACK